MERRQSIIAQNFLTNLVSEHDRLRETLNNGASIGEKAEAWLRLAELTEIVRGQPNIQDVKKKAPEIVYPRAKTIAFYRHSLELDPNNPEAKRAYRKLAGKTFEETVLARLSDDEYEPPAYLPVSPRLKSPSGEPLNETRETTFYWNMQTEEDKKFIEEIGKQIKKPMDSKCRMSIGIPAYMEGDNIFRTLEAFAQQKGIRPNEFEVIVFENHPADKKRDNTKQEIERFQMFYPQLNVHHMYYCFPEVAPIGTIRKIAADVGLKRRMESKKTDQSKDFIIATNDADSYGMKRKALRSVIDTFDKDQEIASITGEFDYPAEALVHLPTLHALIRFNAMYSLIHSRNKNSIACSGASSYLRSSVYAAIGGFDYKAKRGEDSERGLRLYYYGKGKLPLKILVLNSARFFTDPRRAIDAMDKGGSWREQWQDINWQKNQNHVLGTSWRDFNNSKLATFDKSLLEDEINLSAHHLNTIRLLKSDPNSEQVKRRLHALDRTMKFLGILYFIDLENERIQLIDTSKLEEGLKKYKAKILAGNTKESETNNSHHLTSGKEITIEYDPEKPLLLILPDRRTLRVVGIKELKSLSNLRLPVDYFVIVDLDLFKRTNGQRGYKGLGDKETVNLGKTQPPLRFDFGPEISDNHVQITRRGNILTIKDMNSKNGTIVKI